MTIPTLRFQVNHLTARIQPFSKVSPWTILRGREIIALASFAAQTVLPPPVVVCPLSGSGFLHSKALYSLLMHGSSQWATSRGADPPYFGVGSQSSGSLLVVPEGHPSHVSPPTVSLLHPDPNGFVCWKSQKLGSLTGSNCLLNDYLIWGCMRWW
jgi:hypothetical protein